MSCTSNGKYRHGIAAQLALFVLILAGCGGGGSEAPLTPASRVSSIVVAGSTSTVPIGDSIRLTATPKDAQGADVSGVALTWTSSDNNVATVAQDGTVRALGAGSVTITAAGEGRSGAVPISIRQPSFITRAGSTFMLDGAVFRIAGSNSLVSTTSRDLYRVESAISEASAIGVRVLRIWGASEIGSLDGTKVTLGAVKENRPYYQYWDPVANRPAYNDGADGLQVLDHAVALAKKSGIRLVVSLVDNYSWYWGGADQYLRWFGKSSHGEFFTDPTIRQAYKNWIAHLLNRVNAETGLRYADEPAIMAWNIGNEVSCYGDGGVPWENSPCRGSDVETWAADISAYVKSLDSRHLVSIGDVGYFAARPDAAMGYPYSASNEPDFEKTLAIPSVDYGTYHMYPHDFQNGTLDPVAWGTRFISDHIAAAKVAGKPAVLEEFGARDPAQLRAALDAWLSVMDRDDGSGFMFYQVGARNRDGSPAFSDGYSVYRTDLTASALRPWLTTFGQR